MGAYFRSFENRNPRTAVHILGFQPMDPQTGKKSDSPRIATFIPKAWDYGKTRIFYPKPGLGNDL